MHHTLAEKALYSGVIVWKMGYLVSSQLLLYISSLIFVARRQSASISAHICMKHKRFNADIQSCIIAALVLIECAVKMISHNDLNYVVVITNRWEALFAL